MHTNTKTKCKIDDDMYVDQAEPAALVQVQGCAVMGRQAVLSCQLAPVGASSPAAAAFRRSLIGPLKSDGFTGVPF